MSRQGCILKCRLSACYQTKSIRVTHFLYDIFHECFLPRSHIHLVFITTIFIIIQRCHLPSLNLPSQQSPTKSNPCLYWWAVIKLSSFQCCSDGCRTWQTGSWHPGSALSTIQFEQNTIKVNPPKLLDNVIHPITVFWCGYYQGISICRWGGGISTLYLKPNDTAYVDVHTVCMCILL